MEILSAIRLLLMISAVFYFIVHLGLSIGVRRCKQAKITFQPFVSVIVAARNEEKTIHQLLECLLQQTYAQYEIIIINDRSTDDTRTMLEDAQKKNSIIKRIDISTVPQDMPAKKNALRAGIEASKGEILCFTDADCFPSPSWVEELVRQFEPGVGLVAGYSPYQLPLNIRTYGFAKRVFYQFITYEEFRAAIWSAGSIGWKLGWLCTGRNLAYRKIVYDAVQGFEQIKQSVSGDDDLFLQLVRRQTTWDIRYIQTSNSFVPTIPPSDFRSFIEQRKRHFSASKVFTVPMMLFFFFYHLSNFFLFISPILFLLHMLSLHSVLISISLKLLADAMLVIYSSRIFNGRSYHRSLIVMEVLYMLYNSFIGPLGIIKKFAWKQ
jgi:cellulose synthase/poly-beta-1,6-N-acetylglucosamine synthase-like glycosyltransferase